MKTSEQINELAAALAAAQGAMPDAAFDKDNPFFKSRYATLASVRAATVPHLSAHGLSILQVADMDEHELFLLTRLLHSSGQWVEGRFSIKTDLEKPQAVGSYLTYARRYAWMAMCGVASVEDDDDANSAQATAGHAPSKPVDSAQVEYLKELIEASGSNLDLMLAYLKVKTLADLNQKQFEDVKIKMKGKIAKREAEAAAAADAKLPSADDVKGVLKEQLKESLAKEPASGP